MLLVCPAWKAVLPIFWDLAIRRHRVPDGPAYLRKGAFLMPQPAWATWVFLIDWPAPPPTGLSGSPVDRTLPRGAHCSRGQLHVLSGGDKVAPEREPPLAWVPLRAYSYVKLPQPPRTGIGHSLLSQGVEPNPGPERGREGLDSLTAYLAARRFLTLWGLLSLVDIEDCPPPDPGPSGPTSPRLHLWAEATCVCGTRILLRPHGHRPLATHIAHCRPLHRATGRGETLATCGDVEENPGPGGGYNHPWTQMANCCWAY